MEHIPQINWHQKIAPKIRFLLETHQFWGLDVSFSGVYLLMSGSYGSCHPFPFPRHGQEL